MAINYWWVNHKMTFRAESEGGYIWSPKETSNGASKPTWDNLARVRAGDWVFSFAEGIRAIGVATDKASDRRRPAYRAPGAVNWNEKGHLVPITWTPLETALSVRDHIDDIRPYLPEKYSPVRHVNGYGNQGCYLAQIDRPLVDVLLRLIEKQTPGATEDLDVLLAESECDQIEREIRKSTLTETEKAQLVFARRGQGAFRRNVLTAHKQACRVTGVRNAALLIASHIKPWKASTNEERLDHHNGLLLAPHIDRLFDKGHITFSEDGRPKVANAEVRRVAELWGVDLGAAISPMSTKQAEYMAFHREFVFKNPSAGRDQPAE